MPRCQDLVLCQRQMTTDGQNRSFYPLCMHAGYTGIVVVNSKIAVHGTEDFPMLPSRMGRMLKTRTTFVHT